MENKKKFTPGPWVVFDGGHFLVYVQSHSGCVAKNVDGAISREQWVANAHLISAAPELLEALENIIESALNDQEGAPDINDIIDGERAIKKAYGDTDDGK